jgi:hypothetical protein
MTSDEALKHIRTLVRVALNSDDPSLLRKHLQMIGDVAAKAQEPAVAGFQAQVGEPKPR